MLIVSIMIIKIKYITKNQFFLIHIYTIYTIHILQYIYKTVYIRLCKIYKYIIIIKYIYNII
jgi:hypothetical protein